MGKMKTSGSPAKKAVKSLSPKKAPETRPKGIKRNVYKKSIFQR